MYKYISPYNKRKTTKLSKEEAMIAHSTYTTGDYLYYKNRSFLVKYAEVRNNELMYFTESRGNYYWLPERLLAP